MKSEWSEVSNVSMSLVYRWRLYRARESPAIAADEDYSVGRGQWTMRRKR